MSNPRPRGDLRLLLLLLLSVFPHRLLAHSMHAVAALEQLQILLTNGAELARVKIYWCCCHWDSLMSCYNATVFWLLIRVLAWYRASLLLRCEIERVLFTVRLRRYCQSVSLNSLPLLDPISIYTGLINTSEASFQAPLLSSFNHRNFHSLYVLLYLNRLFKGNLFLWEPVISNWRRWVIMV